MLGLARKGAPAGVCAHCRRTPLIGERVYLYKSGSVICELCRVLQRGTPVESRLVHHPELGNTVRIRITDRRTAA
jgi:hypothetical protein